MGLFLTMAASPRNFQSYIGYRHVAAVQISNMTGRSRPLGDGDGNRELQFAKNVEIGELAIHYALVLFFLGLRQSSGNGHP